MAQRKKKKKEDTNKSNIDVINPENYTISQLKELDAKTDQEKEKLNQQLSYTYKNIRGKLWLWWLLPIFGWLIYAVIMQNRLQTEENQTKLILIKRQIAEKEIQLVLDQKRRDEINNTKH